MIRLWVVFGLCTTLAAEVVDFEFRGYLKKNATGGDDTARAKQVNDFLTAAVGVDFLQLRSFEYESNYQRIFFYAYARANSTVREISAKYEGNEDFTVAFWRELREEELTQATLNILKAETLSSPITTDCKNGGTKLYNNTCACPPFTTGRNCENVACQRKGVPEGVNKDRCFCPPGWYAQHCEIRGCRPPLEDNLSVDSRSFLLVLPVGESKSVRITITNNIKNTLTIMNNQSQGPWLKSYLLNLIIQTNEGFFVHYVTVAASIDAFVDNLQNTWIVTQKNSTNWPIMDGLVRVQQFSRKMNPNSIIVVFSDRGDSNAGKSSFNINDNTLELQATQTAMLWRSKVYFFMLDQTGLITTGDQYDTFRRLSTFSHGDLFVITEKELPTILNSVITKLVLPEYLDVRSFATCGDFILDTHRDDINSFVTVFITLDKNSNTPKNWTITAVDSLMGATFLEMESIGPYWAVFKVPPGWENVRIKINPTAICSAKAFITSRSTLLWAYSDDHLIDVGNCMNLAEMPMMITLNPVHFPLPYNFSVEFTNSATGNVFTYPMAAEVREEEGCTFGYMIKDLPSCAAGPYTQKYTFTTSDNRMIRRIHPGFCSHGGLKTNLSVVDPPMYPPQGPGVGTSCYLFNPPDMGGKLHDFRQIVFAIEMSTDMVETVRELNAQIGNIVNGIYGVDDNLRQYSLIVFDSVGGTALVSDYDPTEFIRKFRDTLTDRLPFALPPSAGAFSLDAIYEATQLEILSPAIIHVFTKSIPKGSNHYWVLPTDVQVNFFFMDSSDLGNYNDIVLMQRQSGGRRFSLAAEEIRPDFFKFFKESITQNNLLYDSGAQSCKDRVTFDNIYVEKSATSVLITVLGKSSLIVAVHDDAGKIVELDNVLLQSVSSTAVKIDTQTYSAGQWKVIVLGGSDCYIQVHAQSTVNVAVGFTTDIHSDFPAKHPFAQRSKYANPNVFPIVRATKVNAVSEVTVRSVTFTSPWNDGVGSDPQTRSIFTTFNPNTCAYQFRPTELSMPQGDNLKLIVTGVDTNGTTWRRQFNYYTPQNDDSSECFGGKSNQFGECDCPGNFTGEYCHDRVCAYGSTPSKGICMCYAYFNGDRCENIRYNLSTSTEPPYPPSTTTMGPVTITPTTVATTTRSSQAYFVEYIIMFLFVLHILRF